MGRDMAEKEKVTFAWIAGILTVILIGVGGVMYDGISKRLDKAEEQIGINSSRLSALEEFSETSRDDRVQLHTEVAVLRKELNDKIDYIIRLQLEAKKK